MATADGALPTVATDVTVPAEDRTFTAPRQIPLKRGASYDRGTGNGSPKRTKHDGNEERSRRSPSPQRQRMEDVSSNISQERLRSATQEEKKRGKRLFGGLLSTLSQTTNTQQKRRQEIEKKQHERVQKQKAEDDHKRTEKLAYLRDVRMAEQIVFEEKVIKAKHAKKLILAKYLQTKAEPHIYYLPWNRTSEQEDIIDGQIREAKAIIEEELEAFEVRKTEHIKQYGGRRRSSLDGPPGGILKADVQTETASLEAKESELSGRDVETHHHDESGDVLVEADEDMVIY